ncbi:prepilin-type N-terminal cleavage/methylation domain-containing protein [Eubacterium sp.]|uniref:prepilin-type N-terminal cleavage/methylation domain-containing protein n=1 Tax=Eubacterium sp. TaxID=142586 RepID=UPI002585F8C9|nr:prepilin-type N-terminal cleavage/methylation domain-containing protein [Eubacterium sp.]MCR5367891.1 prepilin-type N-terminal cleavage/methylation domain-containing protein [Eubacterium sp.]
MKKTNRGFSLVELIIVIAIMAILAAAIAPALIRYIDKSRRADDVTAAGTVLTGVQTAMADEDCYSEIAKATSGQIICSVKGGKKGNVTVTAIGGNLESEISSTLAGGCDIKYTKDKAAYYNVTVNGEVLSVYIGTAANKTEWEIQPVTCKKYK